MPSRGIRNLDFSGQTSSDTRLKIHGHQDRERIIVVYLFIYLLLSLHISFVFSFRDQEGLKVLLTSTFNSFGEFYKL